MEYKDVKQGPAIRLGYVDVWVCRDIDKYDDDNTYSLFDIDCDPRLNENGTWVCACTGKYHLIDYFCSSLFRQYAGIRRHMRKGTRKKVQWVYPLQFMK